MALQIYNTTVIGSGVQVNLGSTDDVYVGKDGFISSTDHYAIYGNGSNHSVIIEGSVFSTNWAIWLGNPATTSSAQQLTIGKDASVSSAESVAVGLIGDNSWLKNNGTIQGATGVSIDGGSGSGLSQLVNNGEIHATKFSAVNRTGNEDFKLTNNGTVRSDVGDAYAGSGSNSAGDQTLINNGRMVGSVYFGEGNDVYAGASGKITGGNVAGGSGDDRFTGGKYAEFFEGDAGRDIFKGGGGADHFDFIDVADSTVAKTGRDLIQDFSHAQHDRLDIVSIDANASSSTSDQNFSFVGTHAFSGAEGELRYSFKGSNTFVQGDTDGDKHADFAIELEGHLALHASDFAL
jgi:hypothetical protein